jgi:hypothetical protein
MDHHEAVRKFEHLMLKEADHAREVATELEALAPILTTENSRQLAQIQIKASTSNPKSFANCRRKLKRNSPGRLLVGGRRVPPFFRLTISLIPSLRSTAQRLREILVERARQQAPKKTSHGGAASMLSAADDMKIHNAKPEFTP